MLKRLKKYLKYKIVNLYELRYGTFYFRHTGFCPCCEKNTVFIANHHWLRDHFKCNNCGCIPRERALMQVIKKQYPNWEYLTIHESSPGNRGHSVLLRQKVDNYIQTHYFPNKKLGGLVNGYRNENLEQQTFEEECFDLVVTSDVMEHIYHPDQAFKEIHRTLKQGGAHVFSVPLVNKHKTSERWANLGDNGVLEFLQEPDWHDNPIDKKGSPVTFHWGYDIKEYIEKHTDAECEIIYLDNLDLGIRAEYIEIIVAKKSVKCINYDQ
ncbi:class I SAM-dependent methyltransferase [Tamlana fucoidanivorans]|uniref:Class I SAM-dependent methyltransferase n=1 Tax=Allotamlana fucoidanivorans TaxID=2583814 RepID=A0A5C4SNL9_9FLAO|nr:class I SAM-dependent methyltransferase [Tamlana fucoidanivorans]TNJ45775.1 class I SAM-dependent methyltransferase [Tamlana fucoidanivorans]